MDSYKFLIDDDSNVFAVEVNGVIIPKKKTLYTRYWDEIWNLEYILQHYPGKYSGLFQITNDEYNEIISGLKSS